jgi:hypothetical protein
MDFYVPRVATKYKSRALSCHARRWDDVHAAPAPETALARQARDYALRERTIESTIGEWRAAVTGNGGRRRAERRSRGLGLSAGTLCLRPASDVLKR